MKPCAPPEPGRFSAEPWFRWVELTALQTNESAHAGRWELSDVAIAEHYGIGRSVLGTARRRGLTWRQADEWAMKVGLHPAHLWPEWVPESEPAAEYGNTP